MENTSFIILSIIIAFFAYFVKGLAGFGPSLIIIPVFSLFIDIKQAIIIAALADLLSSGVLIGGSYKHINWKIFKRVGIGLLVGTLLGVSIFRSLDSSMIKRMFGILLLSYIVIPLFLSKLSTQINRLKGWFGGLISGFVGGICGGMFNTNGPPLLIYISTVLSSKESIRSTMLGLLFVDSLWRITLFVSKGFITSDVLQFFGFVIVPALLLGVYASFQVDKIMKNQHYLYLTRSLLFVLGMNLILS